MPTVPKLSTIPWATNRTPAITIAKTTMQTKIIGRGIVGIMPCLAQLSIHGSATLLGIQRICAGGPVFHVQCAWLANRPEFWWSLYSAGS